MGRRKQMKEEQARLDALTELLIHGYSEIREARMKFPTQTEPGLFGFSNQIEVHAAPAVRHCLQAFLLYHKQDAPDTRDLTYLCSLCSAIDASFQGIAAACAYLNPYVQKPLQDPYGAKASRDAAQQLFNAADSVVAFMYAKLPAVEGFPSAYCPRCGAFVTDGRSDPNYCYKCGLNLHAIYIDINAIRAAQEAQAAEEQRQRDQAVADWIMPGYYATDQNGIYGDDPNDNPWSF